MGLVELLGKMSSLNPSLEVQDIVPRKKRTFDIAFLTGQSENSSEAATPQKKSQSSSSSSHLGDNSGISSVFASDFSPGDGIPVNFGDSRTVSEATRSSSTTSSSIDIMTNGSFVTSDSDSPGPELSPRICESTRKPAAKPHKYRQSANNNNRPQIKSFLEDVRTDCKRGIEVNHHPTTTSSGVGLRNGKDNLHGQQFSGGLQHPTPHHHHSPAYSAADFRLPHLASTFVFLPQMQMGKFPIHFPGGLTTKGAGDFGNLVKTSRSSGFPSESHYIAAATAAAYPYHYPNFMMTDSPLRSSHQGQDSQLQLRPHSQQQQHQQQPQQQSPGGQGSINAITSAGGTVSTLLPPSLTALSLPAQNVCAKCNIGFRMTSDLVYHMRSHHKRETDPMKKKREDKLKCPVCHETFRERHHLTRHMTAHQDRAEEIESLEASKVTIL